MGVIVLFIVKKIVEMPVQFHWIIRARIEDTWRMRGRLATWDTASLLDASFWITPRGRRIVWQRHSSLTKAKQRKLQYTTAKIFFQLYLQVLLASVYTRI